VATWGDDVNLGATWALPKLSVNSGIAAAETAGCDVWIGPGVFKPTTTSDRSISVQLAPGVAVYGGFLGTETSFSQRDLVANPLLTTLSGDIGVVDDVTDNSYHVVVGASDAILDGVTITRGYADGSGAAFSGGGLHNPGSSSNLTVANCRFFDNGTGDGGGAGGEGGGLFDAGSGLLVTDSIFEANWTGIGGALSNTIGGAGGAGGGAALAGTNAMISRSTFTGNYTGVGGARTGTGNVGGRGGAGAGVAVSGPGTVLSELEVLANFTGAGGAASGTGSVGGQGGYGAGIVVTGGDVQVVNCTFDGNLVGNGGLASGVGGVNGQPGSGGGIAHYGPSVGLVVMNSVFQNNTARRGGGIDFVSDASVLTAIINSTFANNTADLVGGAIYYSADTGSPQAILPRIQNSILWGNAPDEIATSVSGGFNLFVQASDVLGGCFAVPDLVCTSVQSTNPQFVNAPGGDLHLQPGSPVQNVGSQALLPEDVADLDGDMNVSEPTPFDADGLPRVVGFEVDLGAYELQI
jgi:hypothetical protein